MIGKVIKLFITKDDEQKTRLSVSSITVDENGIEGDKFYAKDTMRSILVSSEHSYKLSRESSIDLETGSLGENILIDINPYSLVHGDRLKIGDTLLQITQNCTLCKGLSSLNSKLPKLLKNDRGLFAKVIKGSSEIHLGDKVEILNY